MDAKHIIALALLLLAIPTSIIAASISQRARDVAFFLMVVMAVIADRLTVSFVNHYWYHGTTRAFEVSLLDVLAIGVLVSSLLVPRRGESRFYWPVGLGFLLLFFSYASLSVMFGQPKLYGAFELSKMFRGILFFLAAAWFVRSQRELAILMLALCCAVSFEGALALKQRVFTGVDRVPGTLDHANSLSMYICTVSPLLVAAAASTLPKIVRWFSIAAIFAAALAIVLTISRAGVPIFLFIMAGAAFFCVPLRLTPKKIAAAALVALCLAGLFVKTWGDLKERYAEATFKDEYLDDQQEGRGYYLRLAKVIVEENFFGVGLNNWAFWVAKKYGGMIGRSYDDYSDLRGREPNEQDLENLVWPAPAHNLGALTLGELGVPGLILFAVLWLRWFQMGARFLFKKVPDAMQRLGAGLFFSLCGIFLQSLTEWVFRQTHIFLTFNILLGTLAALCYAKRRARLENVERRVMSLHPDPEFAALSFAKEQPCA